MPEIAEKFNITRDTIMQDLEYGKRKSAESNSWMPFARMTELQGRAIGIGFERKVIHRHELIDTRQLINDLEGQTDSEGELERLSLLIDKSNAVDADDL